MTTKSENLKHFAGLKIEEVSHPGPKFPAGEDTWTHIATKIGGG